MARLPVRSVHEDSCERIPRLALGQSRSLSAEVISARTRRLKAKIGESTTASCWLESTIAAWCCQLALPTPGNVWVKITGGDRAAGYRRARQAARPRLGDRRFGTLGLMYSRMGQGALSLSDRVGQRSTIVHGPVDY